MSAPFILFLCLCAFVFALAFASLLGAELDYRRSRRAPPPRR